MSKKDFWEFENEKEYGIILRGFFDYNEYVVVEKILKENYKVIFTDRKAFWWEDSHEFKCIIENIKLYWKFGNWSNVTVTSENCKIDKNKSIIRSLMIQIFHELIKYTNPEVFKLEGAKLPYDLFLPSKRGLWCINGDSIEIAENLSDEIKSLQKEGFSTVIEKEIKFYDFKEN